MWAGSWEWREKDSMLALASELLLRHHNMGVYMGGCQNDGPFLGTLLQYGT